MSHMHLSLPHIVHLLSLADRRVYELGPMPTEIPPGQYRQTILTQLQEAGLTDEGGGRLTPLSAELLSGLTVSTESFWGILTLHNERQPVHFDVDDHWLPFIGQALRTAAMTGPRVYFRITRTSPKVMTTAVRNGEDFAIADHTITRSFTDSAAEFITGLANPNNDWEPANFSPVSLPYRDLETAPGRGYSSDAPASRRNAYRMVVNEWTSSLNNHLNKHTTDTLRQLLTADHVADMKILYTHGPEQLTSEHSATVDFFHRLGMVTTYPRQIGDGTLWKYLAPATPSNLVTSLTALVNSPQTPMPFHDTGTANLRNQQRSMQNVAAMARKHIDLDEVVEHIDPHKMVLTSLDPASDTTAQLRAHLADVIIPAWVRSGDITLSSWSPGEDCPLLPPTLSVEQIVAELSAERRALAEKIVSVTEGIDSLTDFVTADLTQAYRMVIMTGFAALAS